VFVDRENLTRGAQTLDLAPGKGAVVELTVEEEGSHPFVSHDFHDHAKGAFGLSTTNGDHGRVGMRPSAAPVRGRLPAP
jgi:hypothetical protein